VPGTARDGRHRHPGVQFRLGGNNREIRGLSHSEKFFVFIARDERDNAAGFITLHESYALYAEGAFGTIPEFYVRPEIRSNELGLRLVSRARSFGSSRGWSRLGVTTPPLPQFDRTLAFYEPEGFSISGGCKLKVAL
jgi:GNAT superfamily N-acetyltransferase